MQQFTLYWKNGTSQIVEGTDASDAFRRNFDIKDLYTLVRKLAWEDIGDTRDKWVFEGNEWKDIKNGNPRLM